MERRDKRGPEGKGPVTGHGLSQCAGNNRTGDEADVAPTGRCGWFGRRFSRGPGRGNGRGEGFGRRYGSFGRGPTED